MLSKHPDTALMLACCGIPALYAGDYRKMNRVHDVLLKSINALSDPVVVVLCAACARTFLEFLPEIRCISLYEYICENGLPEKAAALRGERAIFDPCSSRKFPGMQEAVREILCALGSVTTELPENRRRARCCGQGGHIYAANPELSRKFARAAAGQSELPFLTYCTNCRNQFLTNGKQSDTLLDAVFGIEPISEPVHLAERDTNRRLAKANALREFWGEDAIDKSDTGPAVFISEKVLNKMDALLITETEGIVAIASAENNRNYFEIPNREIRVCEKRIGITTVWVEYKLPDKGVFEAVNVYSHRVEFLPCELEEKGV